jgi:hypothetical protein
MYRRRLLFLLSQCSTYPVLSMSSCSWFSNQNSSYSLVLVPGNLPSQKWNLLLLKVLARLLPLTRRISNTVQSRPQLRWGTKALRTAQHHPTSVLDEYRTTFNQDERGSQVFPFFSFLLCTVLYKARLTNALSLYQLNYQLYISGTISNAYYLISRCRSFLEIRERKQVPPCGCVVLHDPSYSNSYRSQLPHSW